jgi:hypothetical protein
MSKYGTNWRYSKDTNAKGNPCWRIDSAELSLVATLTYLDEQQRDESEHYAKLIAAAPQLLASCVQLLAICYSRGEKLGVAGGGPVIDGAIQAIETAGGELPSYHFLKNPE